MKYFLVKYPFESTDGILFNSFSIFSKDELDEMKKLVGLYDKGTIDFHISADEIVSIPVSRLSEEFNNAYAITSREYNTFNKFNLLSSCDSIWQYIKDELIGYRRYRNDLNDEWDVLKESFED